MKQLEAALGVQLFDRRGVTPTLFGEIVLRHGERAVAQFQQLGREIALAKGIEIGELRVSAGPYPADISATKAIGVLTARHPMLAIELRVANWTSIVDGVREDRIDLGLADISEAALDPELQTEPIGASQLSFFCAAGHPGRRHLGEAKQRLIHILLQSVLYSQSRRFKSQSCGVKSDGKRRLSG